MLRPKLSAKDSRLEIRLPAKDKELLATAAETDGRSLSNWIRFVLVGEAKRQLKKK